MSLARHGVGPRAVASAYASQIHPVFMLPPVAASLFGAVLAGEFSVPLALLHATAAFFAVYTAHLKDGYVDFHVRGEDDDHPLSASGCRTGLVTSSTGFFLATAALGLLVGPWAVLLTLPCWFIGYFHAPQLDMNPAGATGGYPAGIALVIVGGHYVQATAPSAAVLAYAAVFLVILCGVKVIDDAKDYDYDRSIRKRTVAVVLGRERSRRFAYALIAVGLVATALLAAVDVFPPSSALAPAAFGAVVLAARRGDDRLATMLLVRGSYVFLAVLVTAAWLQPLR